MKQSREVARKQPQRRKVAGDAELESRRPRPVLRTYEDVFQYALSKKAGRPAIVKQLDIWSASWSATRSLRRISGFVRRAMPRLGLKQID